MPAKKSKKPKSKKGIVLQKGTLRRFGYSSKHTPERRKEALCSAVNELGYNVVSKKLTALQTLNKNRNPRVSRIFKKDREAAKQC